MQRFVWMLLVISTFCLPAWAQSARISHIVMGPGEEVYEKFGHNALRIEDPDEAGQHRDVAFNYGLFSFEDGFILKFLRGEMRYWMAPERAAEMIQLYGESGRSISVQFLNLTDTQTRDLQRFLWTNALPENRFYLYNYYTDNCSTKLRDALDHAIGGELRRQTDSVFTGHSYRYHTRRAMAHKPIVYIALAYIIGQPADRELTQWQEMFLPELLQQHLRQVQVNIAGEQVSLVAYETQPYAGVVPPLPDEPPAWKHWFFVAGLTLALVMLALHRLAGYRLARYSLATLFIGWFLLGAIASFFLAMFNVASTHWATYRNENILHLSPAAILVLAVLPWVLSRKTAPRHQRMRHFAMVFALLALGLSVLGLLLKATPFFVQQNWEIILLVLPVHVAVAIILWQWSRQQTTGIQR